MNNDEKSYVFYNSYEVLRNIDDNAYDAYKYNYDLVNIENIERSVWCVYMH